MSLLALPGLAKTARVASTYGGSQSSSTQLIGLLHSRRTNLCNLGPIFGLVLTKLLHSLSVSHRPLLARAHLDAPKHFGQRHPTSTASSLILTFWSCRAACPTRSPKSGAPPRPAHLIESKSQMTSTVPRIKRPLVVVKHRDVIRDRPKTGSNLTVAVSDPTHSPPIGAVNVRAFTCYPPPTSRLTEDSSVLS